MANKHELWELKQMQSLPLEAKIQMTEYRIREWVDTYGKNGVYVSFSGGKDSTVLLDIIRNRMGYKDIPAVFINTGLEYPSITKFAGSKENVITIRPSMNFREVIYKYGYPAIGKEVAQSLYEARHLNDGKTKRMRIQQFKGENDMPYMMDFSRYKYMLEAPFEISHKCCGVMKKNPAHRYTRKTGRTPITAQMASESRLRLRKWIQHGCNAFDNKNPISNPMSFWTEQDILTYIHTTLPLQMLMVKLLLKMMGWMVKLTYMTYWVISENASMKRQDAKEQVAFFVCLASRKTKTDLSILQNKSLNYVIM